MKVLDVLGKPCPIPVIEAKKILADPGESGVLVKVDNIVSVQNLEKMANGYGYKFTYQELASDSFEVAINRDGKAPPEAAAKTGGDVLAQAFAPSDRLVVVVGRDTMGSGAEELGKILIKGFIYSLTELPTPPVAVIFLNSGARLTTQGANTVEDLKRLEEKGAEILTCGTCVNFYEIQDKLAVGTITNMYGITERMAGAGNVVNI